MLLWNGLLNILPERRRKELGGISFFFFVMLFLTTETSVAFFHSKQILSLFKHEQKIISSGLQIG